MTLAENNYFRLGYRLGSRVPAARWPSAVARQSRGTSAVARLARVPSVVASVHSYVGVEGGGSY